MCKVPGCTTKTIAKCLCFRHYMQVRRYGKPRQTFYDRQPVIENGMLVYSIGDLRVLFDADFIVPQGNGIHLTSHGYAAFGNTYAHRLAVNVGEDEQVDHVNHDKLDNRRANLRVCMEHENNKNRPFDRRNKSGYTGVYYASRNKNWVAQITANKKTYYINAYDNPEEAAVNRDSVAQQLFGVYASLNFKDL